jgi:putative MFS transporter
MFIRAMIGGWFSDRLGRKRTLILATLWCAGFSLLNAFVWEPTGLFVARLLTGVGCSAMIVVGITYISTRCFPRSSVELTRVADVDRTVRHSRHGVCCAFLHSDGPWGWRLVFVWGSLGILIPLLACWPQRVVLTGTAAAGLTFVVGPTTRRSESSSNCLSHPPSLRNRHK